jgi:hypothetical protein
MKKKYLIYVPLIIVLLIQIFDKNDKLILLQYLMLATVIIAVIIKLMLKKKSI